MNDSEKYLKGIKPQTLSGANVLTNAPSQYASKQRTYMAERTRLFAQKRAYLSTDYVNADVQGLTKNFYDYTNLNIRLADIVNESPTSKKKDDFKNILFPDMVIDYFPIGAKVITMGNTWIATNPSNMSYANAGGIIARCNASYNSYDYYGNIVTEPIVVEKYSMLGNNNEDPRNLVLMDGYFNVTCQKNIVTEKLGQNKRIILGSKPYHITGFADFIQEFSGNRNSVHIIHFTARIDEPTENDDMVNFVADGNSETFSVEANALPSYFVGDEINISAYFLKNGEKIESTPQYPVTFSIESSDENVISVGDDGIIKAVGDGTAVLTIKLSQNPSLFSTVDISVSEQENFNGVYFNGYVPKSIMQYETIKIYASFYDDGEETDEPLSWTLNGQSDCYSYAIAQDGRSVTIECLKPSDKPILINASANGDSNEIELYLEGY